MVAAVSFHQTRCQTLLARYLQIHSGHTTPTELMRNRCPIGKLPKSIRPAPQSQPDYFLQQKTVGDLACSKKKRLPKLS